MPQLLVAGFVVAHGFITAVIGAGGVSNPGSAAIAMPSWMSWWPGPFGRSWLFDALHLGTGAAVAGGLLWLVAGVALIAAGLGWLGVSGLAGIWQPLALGGATVGLVALTLYFHPFYVAALAIDLAIVIVASKALAIAS